MTSSLENGQNWIKNRRKWPQKGLKITLWTFNFGVATGSCATGAFLSGKSLGKAPKPGKAYRLKKPPTEATVASHATQGAFFGLAIVLRSKSLLRTSSDSTKLAGLKKYRHKFVRNRQEIDED